jgi:hypothetical protein
VHVVRRLSVLISNIGFRVLERFSARDNVAGIPVVVFQAAGSDHDALRKVAGALDLVQSADQLGWRRVQRYVSKIAVLNIGMSYGWYWKNLNACFLSADYIRSAHYSHIGAVILHEAVHARLSRCGIASTKSNKERIEALCRREEQRFYSRLHASNAVERPSTGGGV